MAIDYVIDYACPPKERFGTFEVLDRLKGRARAESIVRLFRQHGDERSPSQMGFEMVRNTPEGEEETEIIIVQDLLDRAEELDAYASYCVNCPANMRNAPFGCIDAIQYPLSEAGERWLLRQLPGIDQPLLWLLLRQGIQEMGYDGTDVQPLRASGTYFEAQGALTRDLQDYVIDTNQLFEMLFLLGNIQPSHAGMLLQFFAAVPRADEAEPIAQIMNRGLTAEEKAQRYPFRMTSETSDDQTIADLKRFFAALHRAWQLDLQMILDV